MTNRTAYCLMLMDSEHIWGTYDSFGHFDKPPNRTKSIDFLNKVNTIKKECDMCQRIRSRELPVASGSIRTKSHIYHISRQTRNRIHDQTNAVNWFRSLFNNHSIPAVQLQVDLVSKRGGESTLDLIAVRWLSYSSKHRLAAYCITIKLVYTWIIDSFFGSASRDGLSPFARARCDIASPNWIARNVVHME